MFRYKAHCNPRNEAYVGVYVAVTRVQWNDVDGCFPTLEKTVNRGLLRSPW